MKRYTLREAADLISFLSFRAVESRVKRGTIKIERGPNNERYIPQSEIDRLNGTELSSDKTILQANTILGDVESREELLERKLVDAEADKKEALQRLRQYNERGRVEDRIVREIKDAVNKYPYTPRLSRPILEDEPNSEHEMLLLVSDAHYPEVVNPHEAMGIEYGPEIARRRMEHIADRTLRLWGLHSDSYSVSKITIAVLGDMLSGTIHEELEITNALPMGMALTDMAYMLHDLGNILSEQIPHVEMIIIPGNHPRMTDKPRFKQKFNNYEYIMGQFVKALAQDKFDVVVPEDLIYVHDIFGYKIGMSHGDGSKAASFAGIPFYGLKNRSAAMQAMRSTLGLERFDMVVMGHFHQMLNWTVGDCHVFINGAIKGGDEFSIVNYSSATNPVQALLTFHKDRGWVATERIPLENIF